MALQKQGFNLSFGQGVDTKTDPNQVTAGKMLELENAIFQKGGLLQKRNGFANFTTLPSVGSTTLTTLNGNLLATGATLSAYSKDTNQWLDKGIVQPVNLQVQPLVRTSTSQSNVDSQVAVNGLVCLVYMDGGTNFYQISDSTTGQVIVPKTALASTATDPRVSILSSQFIITYKITSGGTHLIALPIPTNNPLTPGTPITLSSIVNNLSAGYDVMVANNKLYYAYSANDGSIKLQDLNSSFIISAPTSIAASVGDLISVVIDTTVSTPIIWCTFYDSGGTNLYTAAFNQNLLPLLAKTLVTAGIVISELTSYAENNLNTIFYEVVNDYTYAAIRTDYIASKTVTTAGVISGQRVVLRSVGLASKAFQFNGTIYLIAAYSQTFQPTYFLIDLNGNIICKVAYSNGGGYITSQVLPSVSINGNDIQVCYLIKDFLVSVNKTQGAANAAGIYTQTGINLATFEINISSQFSAEIASVLSLTGGFVWMYDSIKPVELGFQVWPEDLNATTSGAGGFLSAQQYFYVFTYEWTDGQGNLHRSAPSVPLGVVTTGTTSSNTINVPTLRLTYKTGMNPVRLVGYRWSTAQQNYYQFTSIQSPVVNDPTVDSIAVVDTLADSSILGNTLLYTTGGVIENIAPPASVVSTLFKNRLFIVDAEDRNLLWYSKQVIETTPIEMSDLLTLYVAPSINGQGSTGPITALSAMDDKLIIFKKDAIYYLTGTGPDNTGANNDFSDAVFITSTVGCANQSSIVLQPQGIMFQSDKGIWLLERNLATQYIGAPVESFNSSIIKSALTIPGTNQVRFTLNSGTTLMFDYYFQQWGTFTGIPAISSTLYQGLHTYLNSSVQVFQETPGVFADSANPVLMSFTTAWLKLTGLQGYQRVYWFNILSNYLTPHKLNVQIGYDFNPGITQTTLITPLNSNLLWGSDSVYSASTPWGGISNVEQWRVFLEQQKCDSIQVTISELYDSTKGIAPGAGLTMSGLDFIVGGKASYPKLPSNQSVG